MPKKLHVISVGGSIIVPGSGIDTKFLKELKSVITEYVRKGHKFVIVTGGGSTCRRYQDAAREVGDLSRDDLDWLGIHTTRLNAHLVRTIFRKIAHPRIIRRPNGVLAAWRKPVLIASGWKPGWSTDYMAVKFAKRFKAEQVINLSNIKYVYNKDPNQFPDAKPIKQISWPEFRKIVGDKWDPGASFPFDPVASKLAEQNNVKVVIADGRKVMNLKKILSGDNFTGTVIE